MLVNKLTASAPRKTPGQTRRPKIMSEAIAIPVGGQTGVTFVCSEASDSPSLAAAKYTMAIIRLSTIRLRFIKDYRPKSTEVAGDWKAAGRKKRGVFAVRRANYTHRRKGVFNARKYRGSAPRRQCALPDIGGGTAKNQDFCTRFVVWLIRKCVKPSVRRFENAQPSRFPNPRRCRSYLPS